MLAIMLSPSANLAFCLTLLSQQIVSGSLVGSPHRSLRVESQFLAVDKVGGVESIDPFGSEEHFYGNLKCGVTVQVGSADHKFEMCPEECPYYAQDLDDDLHCSFVCVAALDCATRNAKRPIADVIKGHKTCRGPIVSDCEEYNYDGTDSCKKCQLFYTVGPDGLCHFNYPWILWVVLAVFGGITFFLVFWVTNCCCREPTNTAGLKKGERFRSLCKVRQDPDENGKCNLYDIGENLCVRDVAGPGMLLHFRMQVFIIVWALVVGVIWMIMAIVIDNALFILGTRRFGTPRENCILVAWGYETQQRLMWTKIMFLVITYVFTFAFSIWHAIRQQSVFEHLDAEEKTMKDFMAFMTGLPEIQADSENVEQELVEHLKKQNVQGVVGVSIAWNYSDNAEKVDEIMEEIMWIRDKAYQQKVWAALPENERKEKPELNWQEPTESDYSSEFTNPVSRSLYKLELNFGLASDPKDETKEADETADREKKIKDLLTETKSSEDAFVVFESEEARDKALDVTDLGRFRDGNELKLQKMICEPDTVKWENYGNSTAIQRLGRLCIGFGFILLALFVWTTVFYAPYAYQVFCFNYDNGAQPPFTLAMTFCMVVVAGNAIMYEVCGRVSDFIGFKTRDQRESCYLILYVIACMFNVCLDMVTTYFLSEYILDGLGFRTYYGVRILDVPTIHERLETYAMQRMLAENTKAYSFPATFLIPFLIEPFVTIIVPYQLGKVLVASHKECVGRDAELILQAFEFDMGRYGDLLLDMVLGILIFFFPGGYTLILFFGMAGSHSYIYWFDHMRVLQSIPRCTYASMEVDWWGCWMMGPITAMIPACFVFKANCQDYGFCMKGAPLVECMWLAWIGHTIFQTVILYWVVPLFKPDLGEEGDDAGATFDKAAAKYACTWFTANPIHCLRSRYVDKLADDKYCNYFKLGKGHLLNVNPAVNLYHVGKEPDCEEFKSSFATIMDSSKSLGAAFRRKKPEEKENEKEGGAQ